MKQLKNIIRQEITKVLSEGANTVVIKGNQVYTVRAFSDNNGLGIQFIPDSKTLAVGKDDQIRAIGEALNKAMPKLATTMKYKQSDAAGIVVYIDEYKLTDLLVKTLKTI